MFTGKTPFLSLGNLFVIYRNEHTVFHETQPQFKSKKNYVKENLRMD